MSWPRHPRTATMSRPNQRGYAIAARSRGPSTVAAVIVAVVVALLALAGCTGLPTTSPVMVGRGVDDYVAPEVRIVVPPPAPGETPEQIVRGFLRAGAAFQDAGEGAPAVATAYLSRGSVDRWRPTSDVTVFDRTSLVGVELLSGDQVQVTVTAVAKIDESGRYREVPPGSTATATFGLSRATGEWRIELPDNGFGLWINTDDFSRVFGSFAIHYPAIGSRTLVPDVRWFPVGPRLVTVLARAQLAGVPGYLKGSVETGFPDGVKLALDAVSVTDGIATVVLSPTASSGDAARRRAMWAQLTSTLIAASGILGVTVEVQGAGRLAVPEVSGPARSVTELGFVKESSTSPSTGLLRTGSGLRLVDLSRLVQLEQPPVPGAPSSVPELPAGATGLAWSADGASLAALAPEPGALLRWRDRVLLPVPRFATALARPSFDAHGRLWVTGAGLDGAPAVWTINGASPLQVAAEPVSAPWLAGRSVVAVAVSADDTRVVVISRSGTEPDRVDIAGVVRDAAGRPVALATPIREGEALRHAVHAVWIDALTVAVIGAVGAGEPVRPYLVEIGQGIGLRRRGTVDPLDNLLPPTPGARWVVATSGSRGIVVVTLDGAVLVRVGGSWRNVPDATDLGVPPAR